MRRTYHHALYLLGIIIILSACTSSKNTDVQPPAPTGIQTEVQPADPTAAPAVLQPTPDPEALPSNTLIDTALQNGEIDAETALTYKVFAQFSDPRLPARYQGSPAPGADNHILDEVMAKFDNLSPEAQNTLAPFLVPPVYKGSWADPNREPSSQPDKGSDPSRDPLYDLPCTDIDLDHWDYKSAMHSPVRFWWSKNWPENEAVVNRLITAMDDDIWPKLTALMGRAPLPDGNVACNGGSPDFDVYVTPLIRRSAAPSSFPPGCRETPSYIILEPGTSDAILAHEFMHAIQWSYNTAAGCMYPGDYAWLAEATASWAQDYVYPDDNVEQGYIPWFYNPGVDPTLPVRNDSHEYGAYLFFFYLSHHFDQPEIVSTVWNNTTAMESVPAVDKAVPGGLEEVWGDFAVRNYIEPPYDDYHVWDQLNAKPSGVSLFDTKTSASNFYLLSEKISPLEIRYYRFTFDDTARLVTFFNGLGYDLEEEPMDEMMGILPIDDGTTKFKFDSRGSDQIKGLKIQAYFKVQGDVEWQLEDWTDEPYMSFCRDASTERLSELVIILSNSSSENSIITAGSYRSSLQVSDIGCWRYGGDASMLMTGEGDGGAFTDDQTIPNVAFERTEAHPNIPYPFLHFKLVEGQLNRTYHYQSKQDACQGNGSLDIPLPDAPALFGNDLFILHGALDGASQRRYGGNAILSQPLTVNFTGCERPATAQMQPIYWFAADLLGEVLEKTYTIPTGGSIQGADNMIEEGGDAQMKYTWHLEPLFESGGEGQGEEEQQDTQPPATTPSNPPGGSQPQSPGDASLPGVPDYPNSESAQQVSTGMVMITTMDTPDDVAAFYKTEFTSQGWMDASNPGQSSGEQIMLMFAKDRMVVSIMITNSDGETMIMINQISG